MLFYEKRYAEKLGQTYSKFFVVVGFPYDNAAMTTAGLRNMIQGMHTIVNTQMSYHTHTKYLPHLN
jgi:hypothetical protein